MKYQNAVEYYIKNLQEIGYCEAEIARKRSILSNYLTIAFVLFQPGIDESMLKTKPPGFYFRGKIFENENPERIKSVQNFLEILNKEQGEAEYLNLSVFIGSHKADFLNNNTHDAINRFLRAVGFSINLSTLTKSVFTQSMEYLRLSTKARAENYSRIFMIYCFKQGWIFFDPYKPKKELYARVIKSTFLSPLQGRWRTALDDYITYLQLEKNLSLGGIDYQVRKLKLFAIWLTERRIKHPNTENIQQFLTDKKETGVKEITLSKYLYTLKYFFSFLVDTGKLKTNPAQNLHVKYHIYEEGEVLTEQEVFTVIEYLDREIAQNKRGKSFVQKRKCFTFLRNLCLFQMVLSTGLRLSELSGIQLKNLDFSKKTVLFTAKGNKSIRQKIREINLDDVLWETLQKYLEMRKDYRQEYLWVSINGTPLTNSGINKIIKTVVQDAGIQKKISPHRLRATCASLYVKKGVDPFSLKTIMGHRSIATTMDQYTKLTEEDLREIWKKTNPLAGIDDE